MGAVDKELFKTELRRLTDGCVARLDLKELKRLGKLHAVYKHTERRLTKVGGDAAQEKGLKAELKKDAHKLIKCVSKENASWLEASLALVQRMWLQEAPARAAAVEQQLEAGSAANEGNADAGDLIASTAAARTTKRVPMSGLAVLDGEAPQEPQAKCNHMKPTWEQ